MNIYVGNLSYNATEADVRKAFETYGTVTNVTLVVDRTTGRKKGFGFVEMPSDEEAKKAIEGLNGKEHMGRTLKVSPKKDKEEKKL
ncbi:MAG: RNA-binding protein [Thermoplasmata archaeon]